MATVIRGRNHTYFVNYEYLRSHSRQLLIPTSYIFLVISASPPIFSIPFCSEFNYTTHQSNNSILLFQFLPNLLFPIFHNSHCLFYSLPYVHFLSSIPLKPVPQVSYFLYLLTPFLSTTTLSCPLSLLSS